MDGDRISVERTINASPEAIFALLADPSRHHDIDGSGTVTGTKGSAVLKGVGDTFTMDMRQGLPYRMVSTVTEFEQDRRIAWQPFPDLPVIGSFIGGRVWRYELEPVEGGTRVRETWDVSEEKLKPLVKLAGFPKKTEAGMRATLERIDKLVA